MHRISIIIPVYNADKFLERCLTSVLAQTYQNIEVIAVNDGSKDSSLALLCSYAERDNRIRVIDQENGGVAAARNTGLANATGEYILFVDADDWIEPNMVQALLKLIEQNPGVDIAVCSSDAAEYPTEVTHIADPIEEIWDPERQKREFLTHQRLQGMLWNKLIRASLFHGLSFDPAVGYGEDAQIMWKILGRCRNIVLTSQVYYHHVIEPTSISNRRFSPRKYASIKVWREIQADTEVRCPELTVFATERLVFFAAYTLYEMFSAGYEDEIAEKDFMDILRRNLVTLMKAPSISVKTKVFAIVTVAAPGLARKFLSKRK